MTSLIRFFVEKSFYVHMITAGILLGGAYSLFSLNRDLIPPFEWNTVQVRVSIPGASPQEIEKFVTFPIEEALKGLPGVESMYSTSSSGSMSMSLQYNVGHKDMLEAAETINARVNSIRYRLPDSVRDVTVERQKVNDVFLIWLGLEGFDEANSEHRRFFKKMEEEIMGLPGVTSGWNDYRERNVHVIIDPEKLTRHEVSISDVRNVLSASLSLAPVGTAEIKNENYMVVIKRPAYDLASIKELPLRTNLNGNSLRIKDVADVSWKLIDADSMSFINGKPGITLSFRKGVGVDAFEMKELTTAKIEELQKIAPEGVRLLNLVDGPHFVQAQLDVLLKNGVIGFVLVFLILMLFLNGRIAMMTALGLPLAYFGTMIVLYWLGIEINLISLVGMILVIGILVDDAIIVAEKYSELCEQGMGPKDAATQAVSQLIIPVTGTVLTTMVAFAPILLIKSSASLMLMAIPSVVLSALFLSWFESFFILPNHLAHYVPTVKRKKDFGYFKAFQHGYERVVKKAIFYRYPLALVSFGLVGFAGWVAATKLTHNFNLNVNSERVSVYAILKDSNSNEETLKRLQPIFDFVNQQKNENIENTVTIVGNIWMSGRMWRGTRYAKTNMYLDRNFPYPTELKNEIKTKIDPFLEEQLKTGDFEKLYAEVEREGSDKEKSQMLSVLITGGEDTDFSDLEQAVKSGMKDLPSIKELVEDPERYQTSWRFIPDARKLAQHRVSPADLSQKMRGMFTPDEVTETRIGGESTYIYTEVKKPEVFSFESLGGLTVQNPSGSTVPLNFLGKWEEVKSLASISHHEGRRSLDMQFKVDAEDGNMSTAEAELKGLVAKVTTQFPQFEMKVEASDKKEADTSQWAMKVAITCILGVLFVIAFILGSVTQPLIVGLPIPFGLVGVVFALYIHQEPLGLMAIIGLVGTVGVAVNASIVMVDQINRMANEAGRMTREIIIKGASSRLRAIVLTILTTMGGIFPMAYGLGGESGFTQPLAFSMGWGLSLSTIMTVLLIPSFLQIREDLLALKSKTYFWLFKKKPALGESEMLPAPSEWVSLANDMDQLRLSDNEFIDLPSTESPPTGRPTVNLQ